MQNPEDPELITFYYHPEGCDINGNYGPCFGGCSKSEWTLVQGRTFTEALLKLPNGPELYGVLQARWKSDDEETEYYQEIMANPDPVGKHCEDSAGFGSLFTFLSQYDVGEGTDNELDSFLDDGKDFQRVA